MTTDEQIAALAANGSALRYRLDLLEQVVLRLLRALAATNMTEARLIADQVHARAKDMGTRRQAGAELQAQIEMLELLNNVLAAAGQPPERASDAD